MSHVATKEVAPPPGPPYRRHQPEQTLLYQVVEQQSESAVTFVGMRSR
jgi:hypothetical protein